MPEITQSMRDEVMRCCEQLAAAGSPVTFVGEDETTLTLYVAQFPAVVPSLPTKVGAFDLAVMQMQLTLH